MSGMGQGEGRGVGGGGGISHNAYRSANVTLAGCWLRPTKPRSGGNLLMIFSFLVSKEAF